MTLMTKDPSGNAFLDFVESDYFQELAAADAEILAELNLPADFL